MAQLETLSVDTSKAEASDALAAVAETYDAARAEDFLGHVASLLDHGAAAVMIAHGHRLGLFDQLAALPDVTSVELAKATGLTERYLREWLAVMVVAGILHYTPESRRYHLPAEHAASLTREGALGNLAVYAQHVALLGRLEERTLENFRSGRGTVYGDYPCFHQIMAEDSGQTVTAGLFEHILPLAPELPLRLAEGIEVLDAGCGRGAALLAMARRFPRSRFTGYDLGADAIAFARKEAEAQGLTNITFEARDLTGYVEPGRWDLITSFDAVHDQKDPQAFLRGLHASLRSGGLYLMQDIGASAKLENNRDFPFATLLYAVSTVHCTPISIGQGGEGLGTMWGWETAERFLRTAGFEDIEHHRLSHDPMNVWFIARV
ncbi:class I SAM-dependent methyltransferase [Aquibaculum arenosum]|uniref:Class I SAM-dependent methyltransferase n=1 Tax=Aquibaculum arenosum TaxID=3032591 RepID=A0ABT5YKC9_9PROT|nr:class I SAM-dependent methyltransferase [Fodinicurvata sp. CAU 1616]MDF2095383.1 class I SAM-dependent methyltransferase [Fodinicurvata sp. CAU 1616]